jgi:transcriptional regulator with XRE-family HTH domain
LTPQVRAVNREEETVSATRLQAVRKQLGYSAAVVIDMMLKRADALGAPIMSPASLKTKLSSWENGHEQVGLPVYRRLFREIYGRTNEELGFPLEPEDNEVDELRARLAAARTVDGELIERFRDQIEHTRHVDARFGGVTVLDQLRSHIDQIEVLLAHSTNHGHRQALAGVLVDAATLAGRLWTGQRSMLTHRLP